MGMLFMEGFEHVRSATDVLRRFPEANASVPSTLPTQVGVLPSSRCMRIENTTCAFRTAALAPATQTIRMGAHIRVHNCANAWKQISVLNSSNVEQVSLMTICPGTYVQFRLMRGAVELYLSDQLSMDVYYQVELEVTIDPTFGSWLLRINEMTVGRSSGNVNTASSGSGGFSKILFNPSTTAGSGNYIEFDNFYVDDSELYGNISIESIVGVAAGSHVGLTLFGAASNYLAVDDALTAGVNDDTDYVETDTTGAAADLGTALDLYVFQRIHDTRQSIKNVRVSVDAKNTSVVSADVRARSYRRDNRKLLIAGTFTLPGSSGYARYKSDMGPLDPSILDITEFGPSDLSGGYVIT